MKPGALCRLWQEIGGNYLRVQRDSLLEEAGQGVREERWYGEKW